MQSHCVCLFGVPGSGKSTLALHFALDARNAQKYKGVFWLNASNQISIDQGFNYLARHLGILTDEHSGIEQTKSSVLRELDKRDNWLLVFDNLDDIALINLLLPKPRSGRHVIVTTRDQSICRTLSGACITVEPMDAHEATQLFYHIWEHRDFGQAHDKVAVSELVLRLNCLPHAIYLAILYLHENKCTVADYLAIYGELQENKTLLKRLLVHYDTHGPIGWCIVASLRQLKKEEGSIRLLALLSFLYSERIPEVLWKTDRRMCSEIYGQNCSDEASMDRLLDRLLKYGLIGRSASDNCIFVHKSVQMLIREIIAADIEDDIDVMSSFGDRERTPIYWVTHALRVISVASQTIEDIEEDLREALAFNAICIIDFAHKYQILIPELAEIYNCAARYMSSLGWYEQAHQLFEKDLRIQEKMFGVGHIHTASIINSLGIIYSRLGNFEKAVESFQRCLQISAKGFGANHLTTGYVYENLGHAFDSAGRYNDAIRNFRYALSIKMDSLGPNDTNIADTSVNLAETYFKLGSFRSSHVYFDQAFAIFVKVLGKENMKTAHVIESLARTYNMMGMYNEATAAYDVAVGIKRNLLGMRHVSTADTINNIGIMYRDMRKYVQAEESFELALGIFEEEFGVDNLRTANTINNMGMIHTHKGNYGEALKLLSRSLRIKEKAYGKDHIKTADTINNLGVAFQGLGRSVEALLHYARVLSIAERSPGVSHVDIADLHNNIGITCCSLGQIEFAKAHVLKSREILVALLGEMHPRSLRSTELLHLLGPGDDRIRTQMTASERHVQSFFNP